MEINIRLDTNQPNDLAHLAKLAVAFNGSVASVGTPAPGKMPPPAKPNNDDPAAALNNLPANTDGNRITIEMVREAAGKKKSGDVKPLIKQIGGVEKLGEVPEDKRQELITAINALSDK